MAQLVLENLDPTLLVRLEELAQQHRRSLPEEVQYLLKQAIQNQLPYRRTEGNFASAKIVLARSQARYAGRIFPDSTNLIREDRER